MEENRATWQVELVGNENIIQTPITLVYSTNLATYTIDVLGCGNIAVRGHQLPFSAYMSFHLLLISTTLPYN